MKLYTEEQVRTIIGKSQMLNWDDEFLFSEDYLIKSLTPIELPSDEEIEEYVKSTEYYGHCTHEYHEGIEEGAKWMRDKIINNK